VPLARGHGQKHLPIVAKRAKPVPHVDQVTTQVELPPFHELRSPLNLVAIEIVFGHIFEAFRRMSQAAAAKDDKPLQKKRRRILPKKTLALRYPNVFSLYTLIC
jgi:hypothetical protein